MSIAGPRKGSATAGISEIFAFRRMSLATAATQQAAENTGDSEFGPALADGKPHDGHHDNVWKVYRPSSSLATFPNEVWAQAKCEWRIFACQAALVIRAWGNMLNMLDSEIAMAEKLFFFRCEFPCGFGPLQTPIEIAAMLVSLEIYVGVDISDVIPLGKKSKPRPGDLKLARDSMGALLRELQRLDASSTPAYIFNPPQELFKHFSLSSPCRPLSPRQLMEQVWPPVPSHEPGSFANSSHNIWDFEFALRRAVYSNSPWTFTYCPAPAGVPVAAPQSFAGGSVATATAQAAADAKGKAESKVFAVKKQVRIGKSAELFSAEDPNPALRQAVRGKRRRIFDKTYRPGDSPPATSPISPEPVPKRKNALVAVKQKVAKGGVKKATTKKAAAAASKSD